MTYIDYARKFGPAVGATIMLLVLMYMVWRRRKNVAPRAAIRQSCAALNNNLQKKPDHFGESQVRYL